jgi:hypothetical protein
VSPSATRDASTSLQLGFSSLRSVLKNGFHSPLPNQLLQFFDLLLQRRFLPSAIKRQSRFAAFEKLISPAINQPFRNLMPSSNLPQRFLLTERFFHNLVALLRRPPTRLGHLFLPAVPSLSMAISLSLIPVFRIFWDTTWLLFSVSRVKAILAELLQSHGLTSRLQI